MGKQQGFRDAACGWGGVGLAVLGWVSVGVGSEGRPETTYLAMTASTPGPGTTLLGDAGPMLEATLTSIELSESKA